MKINSLNFLSSLAVILLGAFASTTPMEAAETVLFSDNFETNTEANWSIFDDSSSGTSDFTAQFGFDYGTTTYTVNGVSNRIPAAPNSSGGTTRGLKFTVNKNDNTAEIAAVSAYPKNQNFSGSYALRFDMWINYNGGAGGGTGSTEFGTFGINHTGTQVNWDTARTTGDGIWFAVTGEGGAARDYRSYEFDGISVIERRGLDAGLIGTDQGDLVFQERFPTNVYETLGAPGKRWVEVEVSQRNGNLVWKINGYVIAERPNTAPFTSGTIMLGYMDTFSSIADPKADNFILFDNVRVVKLDSEPPTVTVEATDAEASEPGTDTGAFTITRTGDTTNPLTVNYRWSGSAEPGVDYTTNSVSAVILAGAKSATVTVKPLNDAKAEPIETVVLTLTGGNDYELRSGITASVNLADDGDGTTTVSVATRRPAAYEGIASRVAQFDVRLSSPAPAATVVNYTLGGTAVNGTDYTTIPSSVTIPSGETNALVTISPINNNKLESSRTATLTLAAGSYLLGTATNATVTIRDDDFSSGTTLFSEDFDKDTSAAWTVNKAHPDDNIATFFYDYSADGIPSAPNSKGSTRGLKLEANTGAGVFTGLSVSPTDKDFEGDYMLRFDMWINYNGPLNGGGTGSTLAMTAGVGTKGTSPQWPSATPDSAYFAITGDGGSSIDYRAYVAAGAPLGAAGGAYAAGNQDAVRNSSDPYYAEFGRESAPAAQLALQPDQTGQTLPGAVGMAWRDVVLIKQGTNVTWFIDGLKIATIDTTALALSTNIFVGYFDINATQTANQTMSFGLVDNLRVLSLASATVQAPKIAGLQIVGANVQINFTGGTSDTAASFTLQSAATVSGPYSVDAAAKLELVAPGQFRAVTPLSGPTRFYQIKR